MQDKLVSSRTDLEANVDTLHAFASGTAEERSFHRKRIKNGKNFVATQVSGEWRFSPSKFAGYAGNGLTHADRLQHRDGRVTDVQITKMLGAPLERGTARYEEVDQQFASYCSAHRIPPSRHPRARRYWLL